MIGNLRNFHLGLECDTTPEVEASVGCTEGTPESIGTVMLPIEDVSMGEGDILVEEIKQGEDDYEMLSALHNTVHKTIEDGEGISAGTAKILEHTLESIYRRYGIPKHHVPKLISVEGFSNPRTRYMSTKIACESLIEVIKSTGKWLVTKIGAFGNWITRMWRKIQASLLDSKDVLNLMLREVSRYNSVNNSGTFAKIAWMNKCLYSSAYEPKWNELQKTLYNSLAGANIETKALDMIRNFFKNNEKAINFIANPDPFNLAKHNPYLGLGRYYKDNYFVWEEDGNKTIGVTIPTYSELTTFIKDASGLVSDQAINRLNLVMEELQKLIEYVTDYKQQQGLEVDPDTGQVVTKTVTVPEIKLEYKQAIEMSKRTLELFWSIRENAASASVRIIRYIMDHYVV